MTQILAGGVDVFSVTGAIASGVDGDVIVLPAGTATWASNVTINKGITLSGAGTGYNGTVILDGVESFGAYLLTWNLVANRPSRMTEIQFASGSNTTNTSNRINVNGLNTDARTFRADHNLFNRMIGPTFNLDTVIGVIDHNTFVMRPEGTLVGIGHVKADYWNRTQGVNSWGDGAWADPDNFGTDRFTFFEDNTFINLYPSNPLTMVDGWGGGRYCFRYNYVSGGQLEGHGAEPARFRSIRAVENYGNSWLGNNGRSNVMHMRGGNGVIWGNRYTGWTTSAAFNLLDGRSRDPVFAPIWGADGRNPWDKNNAGNPFATGMVSSVAPLFVADASKSWQLNQWTGYTLTRTTGVVINRMTYASFAFTVLATGHPFTTGSLISIFGAGSTHYAFNGFYSVQTSTPTQFTLSCNFPPSVSEPTGQLFACSGSHYALISSSTSTGLTLADSIQGETWRLQLRTGETYAINKVDQEIDQIGMGQGSDLGGVDTPTIPAGWNDQTVSPYYEWDNTRENGAIVTFTNTYQGGVYANIQSGVHFIGQTVKPGYTPYTYPHPLVAGTGNSPSITLYLKRLGRRPKLRGLSPN